MNRKRRRAALKRLIAKLEVGENVSQRDMRHALTDHEFCHYLEFWDDEKAARTCQKPEAIKRYQALLTKACTAYYQLDTYSGRANAKLAVLQKQRRQVDLTFAAALEFIQEAVSAKAGLRLWLDRDPFDAGALSPEPASIPRVIGSISHECQSEQVTPYPTLSKREVKLHALIMALESLAGKSDEEICIPLSTLQKKLTALEGAFV